MVVCPHLTYLQTDCTTGGYAGKCYQSECASNEAECQELGVRTFVCSVWHVDGDLVDQDDVCMCVVRDDVLI